MDPVTTMHDRHWVGRNRGKDLKCMRKVPLDLNEVKRKGLG
jgi:hypothetical protein